MKTASLFTIALTLLLTTQSHAADAPKDANKLFHVVSLKFKPDAAPEQIKKVETAFAELKTKVPGILTLNGGTDISPEKKSKGFTHCFVLTFASEKDRD